MIHHASRDASETSRIGIVHPTDGQIPLFILGLIAGPVREVGDFLEDCMSKKDEWRIGIFGMSQLLNLQDWLNGIENEPETEYFFLDKLLQIGDVVLAIATITKIDKNGPAQGG